MEKLIMKSSFVALIASLVFWLRPLYAEDLNYYLTLLEDHPTLQAIEEQQLVLRHQAEGAMGLPDPSVFLGVDNVPVSDPAFDRYLPTSKVFGFSQNIPSLTGRKAERDVFLASLENRKLLVDYTRSRLQSILVTKLADLQKVKQQMGYERQKKGVIAQLQEFYQGQVVAGEPVYQKTFLAETQVADVEQKLNMLRAERDTIEMELIQLVGRVPEVKNPERQVKPWSGDIHTLYPVVLAARNVETEEAKVTAANSRYRPDFGVSGTYKIREDGENDSFDGEDWFSLQFKLSVPLWAGKNQQPRLEAAKSRKRSARYTYQETVRNFTLETTRLKSERRALLSNLDVLDTKHESIQRNIEAMERTYSAGQMSLEPVLQAELGRLSVLSQLAGQRAKIVEVTEKLGALVMTP